MILEVDKYRQRAEIVLVCANHITIEASEESTDLYASMDQVAGKIARQMRKYKTRLLRQSRPHRQTSRALPRGTGLRRAGVRRPRRRRDGITAQGYDEAPPEPEAIQTEKYPVKPMFIDEAVLQMEMSARQFLVFLNAKTETVNVFTGARRAISG